MITTFKTYQEKAMTFCLPESRTPLYMALGLAGEAGEVANKVKKVIRDKNGVLGRVDKRNILAELGDVAWYMAGLAEIFRIDVVFRGGNDERLDIDAAANVTLNLTALASAAGSHAVYLQEASSERSVLGDNRLQHQLLTLCAYVEQLAQWIGFSFYEALEQNIDKLTSRLERGKIGGSGDER